MADITTQTIRDTFLDNLPENVTREEGGGVLERMAGQAARRA